MSAAGKSKGIAHPDPELLVVRAIDWATGLTDPYTETVWSSYAPGWPDLVERRFGFSPGSRRDRVQVHALCETWMAAHGEPTEWPGPVLPAQTVLRQLAEMVVGHPHLEAALDAVEWVDIDTLAEQVAHVASLPVGEVTDALQAMDGLEPDFRAGSLAMAPSEALVRCLHGTAGAAP